MQNTPTQPTVLEIVRKYTKHPVKMGSKLAKDLAVYEFEVAMICVDIENVYGIHIPHVEAIKWKKVKNIVAKVDVLINRLE